MSEEDQGIVTTSIACVVAMADFVLDMCDDYDGRLTMLMERYVLDLHSYYQDMLGFFGISIESAYDKQLEKINLDLAVATRDLCRARYAQVQYLRKKHGDDSKPDYRRFLESIMDSGSEQ
ncbi:MAG: hypothetical protein FWE76_05405 [Symbiobacteriaceae bacterium]|nr:hypothetical protein [Symbiobacteriaceae bacterium]